LLSLFDSPLNKAGLLQVYIKTKNNVLIEINPKCRIPRTFKRFSGLFAQLLTKYKIRASESSEILLKVIKNPISDHLPMGSPIIATSEKSRLVDIDEYVSSLNKGMPVIFVVGCMSQGDLDIDYSNDSISVSSYPLSAAVVCSKLCNSFEKVWDVL
jgi:rRNA small subunit pseudouridine methyltransferase Nep1